MPEYTHQNENRPELGFVSLGDYLNANRGPLDAGYQQDFTQAHTLGDTLQSQLGMTEEQARGYAGQHGTAADRTQTPAYDLAAGSAMQAQEMGRRFHNPYGLAGGANPTSPEASFNSALEYGAHGNDYSTLSGYLGAFGTGGPDASLARGNQAGIAYYNRPAPPPPPSQRHEDVDRNTGGAAGGEAGRVPSPRPPGYEASAYQPLDPRTPRRGPTREF